MVGCVGQNVAVGTVGHDRADVQIKGSDVACQSERTLPARCRARNKEPPPPRLFCILVKEL